jgi:hypothetical protein
MPSDPEVLAQFAKELQKTKDRINLRIKEKTEAAANAKIACLTTEAVEVAIEVMGLVGLCGGNRLDAKEIKALQDASDLLVELITVHGFDIPAEDIVVEDIPPSEMQN